MQFVMDVYCVQWENVWFRMILLYNMCSTETVYTAAACKGPSLILWSAGLHAPKAIGRQSPSPGEPKGQQHLVWDICNKKTWQWGKSWMVEKTGGSFRATLFTRENGIKMVPAPSRFCYTGMGGSPVSEGCFASCIPRFIKPPLISARFVERGSVLTPTRDSRFALLQRRVGTYLAQGT